MMKLKGKLTIYYETGMKGIAMAFKPEETREKSFQYLFLEKGNYLEVYKKDKIYWNGEITEEMSELYSEINKTGYRNKKWISMFEKEMKAELTIEGKK